MTDGMEQEFVHLSCKNEEVRWLSGPDKGLPLSLQESFLSCTCSEDQGSELLTLCDRVLTPPSIYSMRSIVLFYPNIEARQNQHFLSEITRLEPSSFSQQHV